MAELKCPYCHDGIGPRAEALRCAGCATVLHRDCWTEHGERCTTSGCVSAETLPFTRRATAKVVLRAGKLAARERLKRGRERLGASGAVLALVLTLGSAGIPVGALLHHLELRPEVALGIGLGCLFLFLLVWFCALLARGYVLEHDLEVAVADDSVGSYYDMVWGAIFNGSSSSSSSSGCSGGDTGCSGGDSDAEGALGGLLALLAIIAFVLLVLPFLCWLAFELVLPGLVVVSYSVVYWALAGAAHPSVDLRGQPLRCFLRALVLASLYTAVVGGLALAAIALRTALA